MLLRTSSAPLINSAFPPPDSSASAAAAASASCTSSSDHHHPTSPSSFAPPSSSLHQRRSSSDLLLLHHSSSAPPPSDDHRPLLLSRAQSEGDLACFSAAAFADDASSSSSSRVSKQWNRRLSLHHCSPSLDPSSSILEEAEKDEDSDPSAVSCNAPALADPKKIREGFFLSDGEHYTGLKVDTGGSPIACNSKGCRPLTDSECKTLGLLNIAGGVGFGDGGDGGFHTLTAQDGPDFSVNTDAYYQTLLQQDPINPLILRNYAHFLSDKGDLRRSEEYYERAILADPSDGDLLSQYAKLQWDMHKDKERAELYYDRAVEAAPDDCYVMASYASFLWDAEDNEDDISSIPASLPSPGGPSSMPSILLAPA